MSLNRYEIESWKLSCHLPIRTQEFMWMCFWLTLGERLQEKQEICLCMEREEENLGGGACHRMRKEIYQSNGE